MIITLYKNCRLNKSYCEVLDTIAPHTYNGVEYANSLEAYLSTLPKKVFNTGVGTIYGTNSGKIPFELAQGEGLTMYDYNYMKIADETNNFVRYCFILSLQVADGNAIAEYEEDVWASYSATMHVRKSLLTRSRSLKYGNYTIPFYKLGMEYEGNNNIVSQSTSNLQNEHLVNIVAQMQFYQLGKAGEKTNIITRTVCLNQVLKTTFLIDNKLTEILKDIIVNQSTVKFNFNQYYRTKYNIDNQDWYYSIDNIVLVPASFELVIAFNGDTQTNPEYLMGYIGNNQTVWFSDLARSMIANGVHTVGEPITTTTFSIQHNFKILGIGTFSNIYEIVQNGTDINVDILMSCDDWEFNLFLSCQNHIINITENYYINVPISVSTADVTQQAKTARELEKLNYGLQIGKGALQGLQSGVQMGTGIATTALGAITGQVGMATSGLNTMSGSLGTLYSGISNIIKGTKNLQILNKPLYRTSKGIFSRSIGIANAYYGLLIFSINSDNDIEVQANIDNGGYVVNEVVDDLLQDMAVANDKPAYNVMQFDFVNNYGAFPEDIRQRLVDILSNGFKIWYNTAEYIAS